MATEEEIEIRCSNCESLMDGFFDPENKQFISPISNISPTKMFYYIKDGEPIQCRLIIKSTDTLGNRYDVVPIDDEE